MKYRTLIRNTRPFVFEIDTTKVSPSNATFTIPFPSGFDFKCRVNWGDGTFTTALAGGVPELTHTYSTPGVYEISVKGRFDQIKFDNTGDRLLITKIKQWGDNVWRYLSSAFYGCANMNITATDVPNLTLVDNLGNTFRNCTSLNTTNLNTWNVSTVTDMVATFLGATQFNGDLSSWDVSNVNAFNSCFQGATLFNNGGVPLTWNIKTTGSVNMTAMFNVATSFNQPLPWNVSAVTSMGSMFRLANAFNQNIGSWNISNVTNLTLFMAGKTSSNYSTTNLDAIYNGWSALPSVKPNLSVDFGTIKYTAGGSTGKSILTSAPNNWTITDGGI